MDRLTVPLFDRSSNEENFVTGAFLATMERIDRSDLAKFLEWAGLNPPPTLRPQSLEFATQYHTSARKRIPDGRVWTDGCYEVLIEVKINDGAWRPGQLLGEFELLEGKRYPGGLLVISDGPPPPEFYQLAEFVKEQPNRYVAHRSWAQVDDWLGSIVGRYAADSAARLLTTELRNLLAQDLIMYRGFSMNELLLASDASKTIRLVADQFAGFTEALNQELRSRNSLFYIDQMLEVDNIRSKLVDSSFLSVELHRADWGGNANLQLDFDFGKGQIMLGLWVQPGAEPEFVTQVHGLLAPGYEMVHWDVDLDDAMPYSPGDETEGQIAVAKTWPVRELSQELDSTKVIQWALDAIAEVIGRFGQFVRGISPLPEEAFDDLDKSTAKKVKELHEQISLNLSVERREQEYAYLNDGDECFSLAWGGKRRKGGAGITLWVPGTEVPDDIRGHLRRSGTDLYLNIVDSKTAKAAREVAECLSADDEDSEDETELCLGDLELAATEE